MFQCESDGGDCGKALVQSRSIRTADEIELVQDLKDPSREQVFTILFRIFVKLKEVEERRGS